MRKKFAFLLISVTLIACNQKNNFKVEGTIANANDQVVILEQNGLLKTTVIDSIKLDEDGDFSFKAPRPEYPDFYRLRIGSKTIDFAVDSCEHITIKADTKNFSTGYTLEGSQTSNDILTLRKSLAAIQAKVNTITPEMSTDTRNSILTTIEADIEAHKAMAGKLILQNPRSSAAYFAIYQQLNNSYLFSPYNTNDKPYCAAVATAYNAFMPEYVRSKNLYALVLDAIKTQRKEESAANWRQIVESSAIGYIDIELPDRTGATRKLSELEGKVVLLDFSAYEMENNVAYTFELRELYNKYHSRGFEIFQISFDRSKILWQESAANVPWVSVHVDEKAAPSLISTYNVQSIPTMFLMNKKGELIQRVDDLKKLDATIAKLL